MAAEGSPETEERDPRGSPRQEVPAAGGHGQGPGAGRIPPTSDHPSRPAPKSPAPHGTPTAAPGQPQMKLGLFARTKK